MISPIPAARPELCGLPVYVPGAMPRPGSIKLASNENPFGPSPKVLRVIRAARSIERYPDGAAIRLRCALAKHLRVPAEHIRCGAGSDELGDLLARAYLRRGDAMVFPKYTFIRYAMSAQMSGARRIETKVRPDFSVDVDDLVRTLRAVRPRMLCIANPNNPTGAYLNRRDLERVLAAIPSGTLFVLDEAYFEYARRTFDYPDGVSYLADHPNLVVLRTFSKAYGLASLRVGYAVAHPDVIVELDKVRPPFNVSGVAQDAAVAALSDARYVRSCVRRNESERESLSIRLAAVGLIPYPSIANFIVAGLRRRDGSGRDVFQRLAARGVLIRDLVPYGLPLHVRISVGLPSENVRLLRAFR